MPSLASFAGNARKAESLIYYNFIGSLIVGGLLDRRSAALLVLEDAGTAPESVEQLAKRDAALLPARVLADRGTLG